jgi:hypothetical protein
MAHSKRLVITLGVAGLVVLAALTSPSSLRSQSMIPGAVLLADDFANGVAGWTISPLGNAAGWRLVDGAYTYDGGGDSQVYRGDTGWTDYTVELTLTLTTLGDSPGGIRARVNPATGAGYAVWLYPASGEIRLTRVTGWRIDSPGSTLLGVAAGISFDTRTFHKLRVSVTGNVIEVYYDGNFVIHATDTAYGGGVIALDAFNQPVRFNKVAVTYGALLELLRADFNAGVAAGWTISPLGYAAGWSVVGGAYTYDGGGHTQSYRGDPAWADYTIEAKFRLATPSSYPGGLRGRLNPATGAAYAVWLYPDMGQIRLVRAVAWHIDTPGLTVLQIAYGISFDTAAFHALRVTFTGPTIRVYYDDMLVIVAIDTDPGAYRQGVVALDVSNQPIAFDDVVVTYGEVRQRFPSSEPGCDGSDPNVLMCDDFEDGVWYRTNCDVGGVTDPANKGWCGTIYAPIDPPNAAVCGDAGAVGSRCAATSGLHNGDVGGRMMADHSFKDREEFTEVYARYYYKAAPGYVWGWQKAMTWNQCCAGIGRLKWGDLHFPCVGLSSCAPSFQLPVPEDVMQGQNMGNRLVFESGRWYFIEVHMRLNTPPGQPDGLLEVWLDDCAIDGRQCVGTPTLRLRRTDVKFNRNSLDEKLGSIWWENWANPGSTGTEYYDQIKVSKAGPIGFAPVSAR